MRSRASRSAATRRNLPVGVFDSGVGGLTVLRELTRLLPNERFLYFGDTARVPYGAKSPETVRRYAREVTAFLRARGVKAIVVACNTASSVALPDVRREARVPVLGVIEPGAEAAARATRTKRVGVIGTQATVASRAYERALRRRDRRIRASSRACPLFVPLAEEGWGRKPAALAIARAYLAPLRARGVDTLILGCTHYPILKGVIARVMGPRVRIVDSARTAAMALRALLRERAMLAPPARRGATAYFVTDDPTRFRRVAERFLGRGARNVRRVSVSS